jgi:hypothetical protein
MSALCQERTFAIYLNEPHSKILLPENSSLTRVMTDKTLATNIQNFVSKSGIIWTGTRQHQGANKMRDGIYQVSARAIFGS